jgi:hypothetical protein
VALIKVASNATIVLMSRALEEVAREAIELSQEALSRPRSTF